MGTLNFGYWPWSMKNLNSYNQHILVEPSTWCRPSLQVMKDKISFGRLLSCCCLGSNGMIVANDDVIMREKYSFPLGRWLNPVQWKLPLLQFLISHCSGTPSSHFHLLSSRYSPLGSIQNCLLPDPLDTHYSHCLHTSNGSSFLNKTVLLTHT